MKFENVEESVGLACLLIRRIEKTADGETDGETDGERELDVVEVRMCK